jgi:hypothetical protein
MKKFCSEVEAILKDDNVFCAFINRFRLVPRSFLGYKPYIDVQVRKSEISRSPEPSLMQSAVQTHMKEGFPQTYAGRQYLTGNVLNKKSVYMYHSVHSKLFPGLVKSDGVFLPPMWNVLYVYGRLYHNRTPD